MNIVPQEHWDIGYENRPIQKAPEDDPIVRLIKRTIPIAKFNQQAFEIGCYPGRFLSILGDLNYELNGVDTTPLVRILSARFEEMGYNTGLFENESFKNAKKRQYDVVVSFGFIEHFTDWQTVIYEHTKYLKKDGYLLITTPNFKGLMQYLYHRLLDNENLKRHIVKSMSPKKWQSIVEKSNLEVIEQGYIGLGYWDEGKSNSLISRIIRKFILLVSNLIHKIWPYNSSVASYCYLVAKRK